MRIEDRELLERHLPQLRYDAQSVYRACSAAAITDNPGNTLRRANGGVVAVRQADAGEAPAALSLATLTAYPSDPGPARGDYLDEGPDYLAAGHRFGSDPSYAERCYGRVVRDGDRSWLQYWFFHYYNPHNLLGFARHEGDWELVQVGLGADGEPELASFAQHTFGDALEWADVERHPAPDGPHPVVYVAPFSNASFAHPGRFPYLGGIDEPRGDGPQVIPTVDPFGAWVQWPGRWGSSKGVLGDGLGGKSPRSPAHQAKWHDPGGFHTQAGRPSIGRAVRALLRFLAGRGERRPAAPQISARLDGRRALVGYEMPGPIKAPGPRRLYLTVHDAAHPRRVIGRRAVRTRGRSGTVEIELASEVEGVLVRATAFDGRRRRSGLVEEEA